MPVPTEPMPIVPARSADPLPMGGIIPILDRYAAYLDDRIRRDRIILARVRAARAKIGGGRPVETAEDDGWRRYP